MDPNIKPSKQEEEYTSSSTPEGGQVVRRKSTDTPTQTTQDTTVVSGSGANQTRRTSQTIAPSAEVSREVTNTKRLFYSYQIIWYVLALIEIILAFRFVLKLTGANPTSGFADFIYSISYPFAQPFLSLFQASVTKGAETTGFFEWSTLVAAAVYSLIAWGLIKILKLGKSVTPEEMQSSIQQQ